MFYVVLDSGALILPKSDLKSLYPFSELASITYNEQDEAKSLNSALLSQCSFLTPWAEKHFIEAFCLCEASDTYSVATYPSQAGKS